MKNAFRTGERIFFRPLEIEDLERLQGWVNSPEMQEFISIFAPLDKFAEREWLEGLHKRQGTYSFGIALKEGERLIGNCELRCGPAPHRAGEVGIGIGEPAFRGKGYGSEAIRLLLEYGFRTLNLHRISLRVFENNPRGMRCYEKCGFRREGVAREARFWNGRWWSILDYAILENEFDSLMKAAK